MTIRASLLGFGLAVGTSSLAFAQEPPANPPAGDGQPAARKPEVIFRNFREAYLEGKFDVAAETLKEYLAANPTDTDLIELDRKFGSTFVLGLRNLKQWSDTPTIDREAKDTVEKLVAKIQAATKKSLSDPKRLALLVRNLGQSPGERLYSEMELKRAGASAVPVMIEVLRSTTDVPTRTGILGALTKLGPDAVPPFLAGLDGLSDDLRTGVVDAIGARPDLLALTGKADTDPLPHLWMFAGSAKSTPTLKDAARTVLSTIAGNIDRRRPSDELVRLATPITGRKASFWSTDATPGTVRLWQWDATSNNVKSREASLASAEEHFGLRALKWAVELAPNDDTIQSAFLGFATSRAVERAKFADLNIANPPVAALLANTSGPVLNELLSRGLVEKDAALAHGVLQAISNRAGWQTTESAISRTGESKPTLLVRALDFPDDRVAFAAAVAILKSGAKDHGAGARIIDILKRAASADPGSGAARVILADPSAVRANRVGEMFRQAGFDTESVGTTKAVLQRVVKAADIDLIVVDRHACEPLLTDFLTQLRSSPVSATIPVLVVASADRSLPPAAEPLLFRLALLIAATETEQIPVPPPFAPDVRRPAKDNERMKAEALELREKGLSRLFEIRLARLERLVTACNFPDSLDLQKRLKIRLPQLTWAALAAEYPVTLESAPDTRRKLDVATKLIGSQPELDAAVQNLPVSDLLRLIEQLENVLTPETQKKFAAMARQINPPALLLRGVIERNIIEEVNLARKLQGFGKVRVMSEPYSAIAVESELQQTQGVFVRSDKAANQKAAVEWLRSIAIGETPGYDIRPADAVLRSTLKSDDLAPIAVDALARIGSAESQQDLIATALTANRPEALRLKALDAAIRHVRTFGKLSSTMNDAGVDMATAGNSPEVASKFATLRKMLLGKPADLANAIRNFDPASLEPAKPKDAPKPAEGDPKPMPMGEEKPKQN